MEKEGSRQCHLQAVLSKFLLYQMGYFMLEAIETAITETTITENDTPGSIFGTSPKKNVLGNSAAILQLK